MLPLETIVKLMSTIRNVRLYLSHGLRGCVRRKLEAMDQNVWNKHK